MLVYVQYKVNVAENQMDTLKDATRLNKSVTLCFPKGGIRSDHVFLLTTAQVEGKRAQVRVLDKLRRMYATLEVVPPACWHHSQRGPQL